jgi:hypothetical protein
MKLTTFSMKPGNGWALPKPSPFDPSRTLILAFGDSIFLDSSEPIHRLAETYPGAVLHGCSSAGEIFGSLVSDQSLVVGVVEFERTDLRSAVVSLDEVAESFQAGQVLAERLASPSLRAVLVYSDGLCVNGIDLVRGFNAGLPPSVVVTGGLAGDGDRFARTWVLKEGTPVSRCITAVGLYGDAVRVGHGSKGGWDTFGPERLVTRAKKNVLYELDGIPALSLYKTYLGDRAAGLPATGLLFPLAIRKHASDPRWLVRTILATDEQTQSLTFAGDIPEGALAQLMQANFDRLVQGASEAALGTQDAVWDSRPLLAIAISCVGRRLVLGQRTEEELEATSKILPPQGRQIGFYSYGEISPLIDGSCDLHNQTMTLTTICET